MEKIIAIILIVVMIAILFVSCKVKDDTQQPQDDNKKKYISVKTVRAEISGTVWILSLRDTVREAFRPLR